MEPPAGICVSVSEVKASYCMGWVNLVGMLRPTSRDLRQGSPKHARTTSSSLLRLPIHYACRPLAGSSTRSGSMVENCEARISRYLGALG